MKVGGDEPRNPPGALGRAEGAGGVVAAPSPDRLRRSARPSPVRRERSSATAGGMPDAKRVASASARSHGLPGGTAGARSGRRRALEGNKAHGRIGRPTHRQRRGVATDSSAEQGLEVGRSGAEHAGTPHRQRTANRRAEPSPVPGHLGGPGALAASSRPSGRSRTSVRGSRVSAGRVRIFGSERARRSRSRTRQKPAQAGGRGVTARGLAEGESSAAQAARFPPAETRERE
jgi:hypothetical protein